MEMRRIAKIFLLAAAVIVPIEVAAECAPYISSTDPDMPAYGELTGSACFNWGIPLIGGFGVALCEHCTCWYSVDVDGYPWTVNNNQSECRFT